MAVAFRSAASATTATGASAGLTINVPAGVQNNDVMVAVVVIAQASAALGTPGGWTQLDTGNAGPTVATYRRVASSEPASYNWTSDANNMSGAISAYTGGDTAAPINQHGALNRVTGSTTATATTITPSVDNCMLVFLSGAGATGTQTWTGPASYTQEASPNDANSASLIADLLQGAAAATGSISATHTNSGNSYSGLVAITPAAAAAITAAPAAPPHLVYLRGNR